MAVKFDLMKPDLFDEHGSLTRNIRTANLDGNQSLGAPKLRLLLTKSSRSSAWTNERLPILKLRLRIELERLSDPSGTLES